MSQRIRLFLCEDAHQMRALVRYGLETEPDLEVVGEAKDGREGVEGVERLTPDVILLDLSMPDMDGLEAIPLIRERSPATRIVVYSTHPADRMEAAARDRGAHAYVEKGRPLTQVAAVIREVADRTPG